MLIAVIVSHGGVPAITVRFPLPRVQIPLKDVWENNRYEFSASSKVSSCASIAMAVTIPASARYRPAGGTAIKDRYIVVLKNVAPNQVRALAVELARNPFVAGVIARLLESNPWWTVSDVWTRLVADTTQRSSFIFMPDFDPSANFNNKLVYIPPTQ